MFKESDLRELVEFSGSDPVLSIYLNTEPSLGNADAYKLRLRNMIKDILLPQDVEAIERYFNREYKWQGRSVAVFSCAARNFFRSYPLAVPVSDLYHIGDRPSVKPLAMLLDTYGGYGVALVDKQGARLFYFHLGELIEQEGVLGEIIKHTKHGGASSVPGRRGGVAETNSSEKETVTRNMKEVVESAIHFFEEKHVRRILIGGSDDNTASFRSMLPKSWQSLVVGSFPMSMTANHADVLSRTMESGRQAEQARQKRIIETLITTNAKGGSAVMGLEKVLEAVNHGKVQVLVMVESLRKAGYQCKGCNNISLKPEDVCDGCTGKVERIPDVVELAVSQVLRMDGEVDTVPPNADMEKFGNIGAMLRY